MTSEVTQSGNGQLREDLTGEQGFMLVGLLVAIFLILLALSVAAPKVARDLRREREVEAVHRANQYVRAIQLYYKKFGHYPGSMEQLEKSNNIRFLRQQYVDPLTGKADWKLIKVGEAKTTVKGFFGQPLAGLPSAGLGSAAGMASPGGTGTAAGGLGATAGGLGSTSSGLGSTSTGLGSTGSGPGATTAGSGGAAGSTDGSGASSGSAFGSGSSGGIGSQSATSFTGSGAPFMGVGSVQSGESIVVVNEQTTYPTWEFIYDPRVEQLRAQVSIFGGGPSSTSATGLGTASGMNSGIGGTGTNSTSGSGFGTTPVTTPTTGTGTGTQGTQPPQQ